LIAHDLFGKPVSTFPDHALEESNMIIAVDGSGAVSLTEAENFRGFKVVSALSDKTKLGEALKAAGRYDGEHAWITKAWLIRRMPTGEASSTRWSRSRSRRAGSRVKRSAPRRDRGGLRAAKSRPPVTRNALKRLGFQLDLVGFWRSHRRRYYYTL
jgi:hypothetical protein